MAPPVDVNYLAVLVSGIVSMVLGTLWFGPVFGKPWMKLMGITQQQMEEAKKKGMSAMWKNYLGNFVVVLIFAYILSHFVDYAQASTLSDALSLGFWVWLGFIATLQATSIIWERKPFKLYAINTSYRLVEVLVISIILVLWT